MAEVLDLSGKDNENALIKYLDAVAPEQTQFVTGSYFEHGDNFAFGILGKDDELIAAIRYCKQKIGIEQKCPAVQLGKADLYEAKINVFAVAEDYRNQGLGKLLQKHVIQHATAQNCYQVASYSTYDKIENYYVKLRLGFCCQPEKQADGTMGCYFLMRL